MTRPPTEAASDASYHTYRHARTITITVATANKPNCAHRLDRMRPSLSVFAVISELLSEYLTLAPHKVRNETERNVDLNQKQSRRGLHISSGQLTARSVCSTRRLDLPLI